MNQEQRTNVIIISLLVFLLLATALLFVKFIIGKKVLSQNEKNIETILKSLNTQDGLQLTSPIFKTSDPTKGNVSAENIIFEFASFSCPYCQQQAGIFDKLFEKYPDQVYLIWKDVVNALDFGANRAALAARCAQAQGKFWEYHDYLFANQENLGDSELYQTIATTLNLDLNNFNQCLTNQEQAVLIESNLQEASGLGVDGTPYLFINGQRVNGVINLEQLEQMLNLR